MSGKPAQFSNRKAKPQKGGRFFGATPAALLRRRSLREEATMWFGGHDVDGDADFLCEFCLQVPKISSCNFTSALLAEFDSTVADGVADCLYECWL